MKKDAVGFVGGTLVHTESGLVQIQDIQIGDRVLSADTVTGQQSYQVVMKVIKTENQSVIFMEFDYWIDPNLDFFERRKIRKEVLKNLILVVLYCHQYNLLLFLNIHFG
ncbi:polymorphic toxin-type HINT domain-containing protein [Acinetobacter colistiniresistens]|uniref:polymorphic toxin-type HINT domain-containing protein n=1 Tax=Acinetobacter colistiniresistens TaxID=280145 RepID=UPI00211C8F19|nr:polymorphic toxin-type HINT domain-containing protein [Acinetobacter colistiniresistens]UUM26681.1 polymorphic toxin-type HINT domain-containing protein [Acinetobacter colistiniresistens]